MPRALCIRRYAGSAALEQFLEVLWRFAKPVEVKQDRFHGVEALVDAMVRVTSLVGFYENCQRLESIEGEAGSLRRLGDQLVDLTQSASVFSVRSNGLERSHG